MLVTQDPMQTLIKISIGTPSFDYSTKGPPRANGDIFCRPRHLAILRVIYTVEGCW
jgi:hypothetical protein